MQEKAKEPEIRFAGFTGAWEQRKLGDVLEFLKDGTHGTHPDADQGPLLLSAKNIKNGDVTWDDTDRKISQAEFDMIHSNFKLKKGDVLLTIVGSIGESAILKDPHEITFQRSVAFLRPNKTITSGFLYSEIQGEKFQTELNNRKSTSAQPGIYLGDLSEIPLDTPPNLKEQEEIGKFFSEINSLLTLHQRKYEKLLNIKKSMLEKMFPKEGEVVPEIRFKGFTGAWEQRKFSKLYKRSSEKNDGSIGIERNITVATMQFKSDIRLSSDDYLKTYFTFKVGDIAFEGHQSKEFRYGRFVENDIGDGVVSHIFTVFRPIQRFDLHFWKYAINSENLMQKILSRSTKASTMMHDLVPEDFLNETFLVPSIDEQKAVGKFLHQIDNLLTLHQRKLEMLKNVKQAFLEKMFV